jgi:hypothetical protein
MTVLPCDLGLHPDYVSGPEGATDAARAGRCPECEVVKMKNRYLRMAQEMMFMLPEAMNDDPQES